MVHYPELIKTTGKHEGNVEFGLTADSINSKLKQQQIRKKEASHENVMNKNKRVKNTGAWPLFEDEWYKLFFADRKKTGLEH